MTLRRLVQILIQTWLVRIGLRIRVVRVLRLVLSNRRGVRHGTLLTPVLGVVSRLPSSAGLCCSPVVVEDQVRGVGIVLLLFINLLKVCVLLRLLL